MLQRLAADLALQLGSPALLLPPLAITSECGPSYLLYVPSHTVVHNDAAATAARVLGHETLYRWGMLAETLEPALRCGSGREDTHQVADSNPMGGGEPPAPTKSRTSPWRTTDGAFTIVLQSANAF